MGSSLVLCVRGRDTSGEWSWCACEAGRKDPAAWSQDTKCGMHVLLPGHYARRVPDCLDCLRVLGERGGL